MKPVCESTTKMAARGVKECCVLAVAEPHMYSLVLSFYIARRQQNWIHKILK